MPSRMVPLSVRISEKDAEFLAQLDIEGATTPSDKLRAIVVDARRRQQRKQDYAAALQFAQEILATTVRDLRAAEHRHHIHSELISRVNEWLPEVVAYLMSALIEREQSGPESLIQVENGLADRLFTLIESTLQLGMTARTPCYDDTVISQRIEPVLDLAALIAHSRKLQEEKQHE